MALKARSQAGFSLVELVVVMAITLVFAATFYVFFRTNLFTYLDMQTSATNLTELASQSHRVGDVLRGTVGISAADANSISAYAYFYPADTYASLVQYYLSSDGRTLFADVTRMTANPPIGTPIASTKQTFTIMDNFQQTPGASLFTYLDASGTVLSTPVSDLNTIKSMRINLGVSAGRASGSNQAMVVEVGLRNRKTNL